MFSMRMTPCRERNWPLIIDQKKSHLFVAKMKKKKKEKVFSWHNAHNNSEKSSWKSRIFLRASVIMGAIQNTKVGGALPENSCNLITRIDQTLFQQEN